MRVPFWMLKVKWAYQERAMWARLKEWAAWKIAWLLPREVALLAFVRVYSATSDAPGPEYRRIYDAWTGGR